MTPVPHVAGVLTAAEVAATAAAVARVQHDDGAVPWAATDPHVDTWNHVEAAMALLVGGQDAAAARAWDWVVRTQRPDGSWPARMLGGAVEDAGAETNMCAYVAVGAWHHWLVRRDPLVVGTLWPVVRRALDLVVGLQLPFGGVSWMRGAAGPAPDALLTGSASTHQALRCGLALAALVDEPQPAWERAATRLAHAVRAHPQAFLDKRTFSMDWYYPVLGGAVRGPAAHALLAERWDAFVVPGLGARCVSTNPWVTGAETCELVLALDAVGDRERALRLFADVQHLRHDDGSYWTGLVYDDGVRWPVEQTTYTAAAVVLAADALSGTTGGAGLFRDVAAPAEEAPVELGCGCAEPVGSRR